MHCKMCGKKKEFIDAHIFPKSLREFAFDGDSQFKTANVLTGKTYNAQNLEYDKTLFCSGCDNKMSAYEEELKKVIKQYINLSQNNIFFEENGLKMIEIDCLSKRLYLGLISILWKCSLSKRIDINLGEQYNSIFKKWIENKRISPDARCFCRIYLFGCETARDNLQQFLLSPPYLIKQNGLWSYIFHYFGFSAVVNVGEKQDRGCPLPELPHDKKGIKFPLVPFKITPGAKAIIDLHTSIHKG